MTNGDKNVYELLEEAVGAVRESGASAARTSEQLAGLLSGATNAAADAQTVTLAGGTGGGSVAGLLSEGSTAATAASYVNPILGALWSLLGGIEETVASVTLQKTALPEAVDYKLGVAGATGRVVEVDRDAQGQARGTQTGTAAPSVVVNVQAIDTQSFLDRTPEIAQAVRRALLESGGLGAVIGEI
jgi:hypothetical protein